MATLVQWIHVTAAVIGVGGMVFMLFILMPSLGALDPEPRRLLAKRVMDRFRWVSWSVIFLLLVSGLYTIRQYYWEMAWGKSWAFLSVKIVLALFVFLIVLTLTLPVKLFDRVRARRQMWLSITVGLAIAVILISAYLRRG